MLGGRHCQPVKAGHAFTSYRTEAFARQAALYPHNDRFTARQLGNMLLSQSSPLTCACSAKGSLSGHTNILSRSYIPSAFKQGYRCIAAGQAAPVDRTWHIPDRVDGPSSRLRALHSALQHSAQQVFTCGRMHGLRVPQIFFFLALASTAACGPAQAAVHGEPANALSIPTWYAL